MEDYVNLTDVVYSAIKGGCIKYGLGKKAAFNSVRINTDPISSAGIFHLKLQHLNDFIEYILYDDGEEKSQKEKELVKKYAALRQFSTKEQKILFEYFSLFEKLNELREGVEGAYPSVASKIDHFVGTQGRRREHIFDKLLNFREDEDYKEQCLALKVIYDEFLKMQFDDPEVFKTLDNDILKHVKSIIKSPMEIYFNIKREDFTFCSQIYGDYYVLNLKIGRNGEAFLNTGYKIKIDTLRRKRKMRRIYPKEEK